MHEETFDCQLNMQYFKIQNLYLAYNKNATLIECNSTKEEGLGFRVYFVSKGLFITLLHTKLLLLQRPSRASP